MNSFIKINNMFFYVDNIDQSTGEVTKKKSLAFIKVGTEGFTILTYLMILQGNKSQAQFSGKMLMNKFDFFKDYRTVSKYINLLHTHGFIHIHNEKKIKNNKIVARVNDFLEYTCDENLYSENNFNVISEELFNNEITKIGHAGWSILCLLSRLHNYNYSSCMSDYGYADPREDTIAEILNIGLTTVKKYTTKLEDRHLLKVERQTPKYICKDKNGEDKFEFFNNHYIVKHKLPENKYYLEAYDSILEKVFEAKYNKKE